jgi:hypothetical protein
VVPISSNLYALHDARCIISRLTRSIGLELECSSHPYTRIISWRFEPSTITRYQAAFFKAVRCLPVPTAEAYSVLSTLGIRSPNTNRRCRFDQCAYFIASKQTCSLRETCTQCTKKQRISAMRITNRLVNCAGDMGDRISPISRHPETIDQIIKGPT